MNTFIQEKELVIRLRKIREPLFPALDDQSGWRAAYVAGVHGAGQVVDQLSALSTLSPHSSQHQQGNWARTARDVTTNMSLDTATLALLCIPIDKQ